MQIENLDRSEPVKTINVKMNVSCNEEMELKMKMRKKKKNEKWRVQKESQNFIHAKFGVASSHKTINSITSHFSRVNETNECTVLRNRKKTWIRVREYDTAFDINIHQISNCESLIQWDLSAHLYSSFCLIHIKSVTQTLICRSRLWANFFFLIFFDFLLFSFSFSTNTFFFDFCFRFSNSNFFT